MKFRYGFGNVIHNDQVQHITDAVLRLFTTEHGLLV